MLRGVLAILRSPHAHARQFWLQHGAHWWWGKQAPWRTTDTGRRREYRDYEQYVQHQSSKWHWHRSGLTQVYHKRLESYRSRFQAWAVPGRSILCLGARDGMEVEAFRDLGCFAWGIDLVHPEDSYYVTTGDMHRLERDFPPRCVDVVYTNALDHVLLLWKVAFGVQQILKPDGFWWVDAHTHGQVGGAYEAQDWSDVIVLQQQLKELGWTLDMALSFEEGMTSMRWVRK